MIIVSAVGDYSNGFLLHLNNPVDITFTRTTQYYIQDR
jgi:hypothetical protein